MRELGSLLDRAEERKWRPKGRIGDTGEKENRREKKKKMDACLKADASSPAKT